MKRGLRDALARRRDDHLYRTRRVIESPQGPEVVIDGQRYLNFCSNDYLGLANHPQVIEAMQRGAARYGVGSGAAHLICGHSSAHHALEEELAAFTKRQRALLFSTGYMANLGVMGALLGRGDTVLEDRLNHASLIDAARLSGARLQRYPHADVATLEKRLADGKATLIASDGVFSMDGDISPVVQLAALAREHKAPLMIDDAHGLGVLGAHGGGSLEQLGLGTDDVPVLMGTLGKAFGTFGAFVAGSEELIETLIQQARSYIYTTALPPALAEATRASLKLVQTETWRRERLRQLIARFTSGAAELNLPLMPSPTPIQPLLVGDSAQALALSEKLFARNIIVSAIRPPTVPQGQARLRITLSCAHSEAQVDRLLEELSVHTHDTV
ncbi:MAG: 8-amino-7-oxononanoate synthase [Gammaproteobacteria bacterium]|nr:8-amino-7-oxononanoate synthase [Gammaproteobacteria bacterium]